MANFLAQVARTAWPAESDPTRFWGRANLLDIQENGTSQSELLDMFATALWMEHSIDTAACGSEEGPYVYLDDAVFTGNTLRRDITRWLSTLSGPSADLIVVVYAYHTGKWYAEKQIYDAAAKAGISLNIEWHDPKLGLEDRNAWVDEADVLRPRSLGDDPAVHAYADGLERELAPMGRKLSLRQSTGVGSNGIFSSSADRDIVENAFLKEGVRIRSLCPNFPGTHRPLGYSYLTTLGFGSLLATFRNCPNTTPLVFWAEDPWYPLFHRRNN